MKIDKIKVCGVRGINFSTTDNMFGSDAIFLDTSAACLSKVNVFAGRNGSGKSTVLDAVRALKDPRYLASLKRSSLNSKSFHGIDVQLENKVAINIEYEINGSVAALKIIDRKEIGEPILGEHYPKIEDGGLSDHDIKRMEDALSVVNLNIRYWKGYRIKELTESFVRALRQLQSELTGIDEGNPESCIRLLNSDTLGIVLSSEPDRCHEVNIDYLPAGWRSAAALLEWVEESEDDAILVIEEPELHIHPALQRKVLSRIIRVVEGRNLQLLVATHSPTLLSLDSWQYSSGKTSEAVSISVFHVDGNNIRPVLTNDMNGSPYRGSGVVSVLDELGIRASDILQANSVIWVEGPSDRIYIKHWLKKWCEHHDKEEPTENFDYAFCLYGGSVLSHFNPSRVDNDLEKNDFISMVKINRNSFVVMDRDFDFFEGSNVPKNENSAKANVLESLGQEFTWVTHGYTVESYLPKCYHKKGYLQVGFNGRLSVASKISKSNLAKLYVEESIDKDFLDIFDSSWSLQVELEKIYEFICRSQQR